MHTRTGFIFFYFTLIFVFILSMVVRDKNKMSFMLIMIMTFYFGSRPIYIGRDTHNYFSYFLQSGDWMEFGFNTLNKMIRSLTDNPNVFLTVVNFLTLYFIRKTYQSLFSNKNYVLLSLIIFIFFPYGLQMNINIIRQGLSASIFIYATLGLKREDFFFKKIFLILISISFHKSALIYLIIFIISEKFTIKRKKVLLIILLLLSAINLPSKILLKIPILEVRRRLIKFLRTGKEWNLLFKYIYYLVLYKLFHDGKWESRELEKNKILHFYFMILLVSIFLSFSYISATRVLLVLDVLVPILIFKPKDTLKYRPNYIELLLFVIFFTIYVAFFSYSSSVVRSFKW